MIWKAVKYGTMAACLMAIFGMAYMFGVNRPVPINNPVSDPLQGSPIEETMDAESRERADSNELQSEKVEELNTGAVKEGALKDNEICFKEDIPADGKGEYVEVNNDEILAKEISDFYGGSYLDANGKFTIVLTEDTPENRTAICRKKSRTE